MVRDRKGTALSYRELLDDKRRGAAIVEFSIVAGILFLLVMGLIEFLRMEMVMQTLAAAAQEGCRAGLVPGSTTVDVQARAQQTLSDGLLEGTTITITPGDIANLNTGQALSVAIRVPADKTTWLPSPIFLKSKVLETRCTMFREAK